MLKEGVRYIIAFFEYIFSRPDYWLVTAYWFKIVLTWMVGYLILGGLLTAGGILGLFCIDNLLTKDFIPMFLAVLCGGVSLFYGLSLLYQVFYNIYYAFSISFDGELVDAEIIKSSFKRKKVRGNDLSRYHFTIEYRAILEDGEPYYISQSTSIYKSHFYSDIIQTGRTIKVKYWRKDPKKAKIMWNKS